MGTSTINGHFPLLFVCSPEGIPCYTHQSTDQRSSCGAMATSVLTEIHILSNKPQQPDSPIPKLLTSYWAIRDCFYHPTFFEKKENFPMKMPTTGHSHSFCQCEKNTHLVGSEKKSSQLSGRLLVAFVLGAIVLGTWVCAWNTCRKKNTRISWSNGWKNQNWDNTVIKQKYSNIIKQTWDSNQPQRKTDLTSNEPNFWDLTNKKYEF